LKNSSLNIVDGADLHYGNGGKGVLLLRTGSTIRIGNESSLFFDGKLWLRESNEDQIPQQIYMELNSGSELVFREHAVMTNLYSLDGSIKLNIL
jgi:hypothetical protein